MPTNQQAFENAKQKIDQARRDGATELDLSCDRPWDKNAPKLTETPESLGQLTQLKQLILNDNGLATIPESIGGLTQLKTLDLSRNRLNTLPKALSLLTQLQTLDLFENQLSRWPDTLQELQGLLVLGMSFNELSSIPPWIRRLSRLKTLYVVGNEIASIPIEIGELNDLSEFLLGGKKAGTHWGKSGGNRVSDVPKSLLQLQNLSALNLDDNPLNPELAAAYEQGLDAVKAYLRAKAEDQIVLNEAKLILIGEGEVGKTSLLGALRGDEWVENRPTTHGVEVDIKSLVLDVPDDTTERQGASRRSSERDGARHRSENDISHEEPAASALPLTQPKQITFNGWDFGGQNIYRHTHQLFFTAPAVYLAVWNPRRGPEQCCVDEWIKMVRQRAFDETRPDERPRILVVATHGGPKQRSAHIDEQLLRDEFGDMIAGFHHVDSRPDPDTGVCHGLDELKDAIAREAAAIPSVGRSVPTSWKNLLDALQKRSEQDPYISFKKYLAVCHNQSITDELAGIYAAILNELGYLIHYQGDEVLQDTVILKPEYISKAISYVLEDAVAKEQNGLVEHDRLSEIWNDSARAERDRYPAELHRIFLRLMDRFDLSYQVVMPKKDDPKTSLVAQLVPGGRPENWEQDWPVQPEQGDAERRRICRLVDAETGFDTTVEGLLFRLIVRLHRYSLGRRNYFESRHWKTGMILDDDFNGRAFIEEIAGTIQVTVRASYPDGFLGNLCGEIRSLVEQFWKGLDCRLSVPCHAPCKGLHELEELVETKREGIHKVRCSVCKTFYDINSLLVAATPKLPMNVVLTELKKVRTTLADMKKAQEELGSDIKQMIGQANEQFELLMNAMTSLAKDGPRLFSFEPVDPGFWDKPKWIAEKFRLTLWCEHSRLPLPLLTGDEKLGVYKIELTRDWVKKSAPVLKILSNTLSLALPIAGSGAKLAVDSAVYKTIEDQLSFGKSCAEGFLEGGEQIGDWLSSGAETELDRGRAVLAEGATLRELHALLKAKDKTDSFGGLVRVQNKRREFLWVHPQYRSEY